MKFSKLPLYSELTEEQKSSLLTLCVKHDLFLITNDTPNTCYKWVGVRGRHEHTSRYVRIDEKGNFFLSKDSGDWNPEPSTIESIKQEDELRFKCDSCEKWLLESRFSMNFNLGRLKKGDIVKGMIYNRSELRLSTLDYETIMPVFYAERINFTSYVEYFDFLKEWIYEGLLTFLD